MAWKWSVVALLLAGCETGMPIEKFCEATQRAQCEEAKRCGRLSNALDCALVEADDCRIPSGLDAGTLKYDGLQAQKGIDELTASTGCAADTGELPGFENCRSVFVGTGKEGEACGTCAAGLQCREISNGCGVCRPIQKLPGTPLPDVGEPCLSPLGDGPGCRRDAWCVSGTNDDYVCVAAPKVGDACASLPCVGGASCVDGTCVAKADLGEECDAAGCLGGLTCIGGVCEPRRSVGATCSTAADCWSSICLDGVCSRGRQPGEACDFNNPCESRLCIEGTCAALPSHGEACTAACAPGSFCHEGTCVDLALQVCR